MNTDVIPRLKGHWFLNVYDGDVERCPLTQEQVRENAYWRKLDSGAIHLPIHAGEIVSKSIDRYEGDNLIVTTGKQLLLDRLFETAGFPVKISAMGVGASATAAAIGDTQLNTTPTILAFDATPTRASLVVTCVRTFATAEANFNWQEMALFNGLVNGTSIMLNRISPIGPFNKTSAVSISSTVTLTQA